LLSPQALLYSAAMDDLINDPLFQSAALPFVVSLVVALILRPHGWVWAGLAAIAGFAATVYLLTGFEFFPLRSDRKILLLGAGAVVVGLLFDLLPWRRVAPGVLFVAAAAAALWLVWPRFRFIEGWHLLALAIAGPLYAGWMVASCETLRQQSLQADSVIFSLALGTGISALLGATALYGQLGGGIAAAVGARLLLHLLNKPVAAGSIMLVPLVTVSSLLGLGAVVYARLPWYILMVLALIPLMIRVPLPASMPRWLLTVLTGLVALVPAGLAIFLTWRETGAPPI
jgi:hypothetical protein